jgi:DNA mismatch endonuclease (patch repair protein)
MTDVLTKEQRRFNMSRIRARDTGPEIILRRLLFRSGVRGYRLNYDLPGKPDIVFVKKRLAVFIDGCFWHKCPVHFVKPETRTDFWMKKIDSNVTRDERVNRTLRESGWCVLRFWEHEIRKAPESAAEKIMSYLFQENKDSCF